MLGRGAVIFASIGSLLPFDRLVKAVDEWALENPSHELLVQIGEGAYEPRHCPWVRILSAQDYRQRLRAADLFVAHVGMGSILQGLEERKQMLLLPRQSALREHTTDHQLHTAERFRSTPGIRIAADAEALKADIGPLLERPMAPGAISDAASDQLLGRLSGFLDHGG